MPGHSDAIQSVEWAEGADASLRLLRAIAHPLRDHLLVVLTVDGPQTVAALAAATGRARGAVTYHLKVLEEAGAVERVPSEEGATTYRPAARSMLDDQQWAQVPVELRREILAGAIARVDAHVRGALEHGGFDRVDAHVSSIPTSLDADGLAEMAALLTDTVGRAMAIQAGSNARRPDGVPREDELQTEVVMLHFDPVRVTAEEAVAAAEAAGAAPATLLDRMYALNEEIGEELPREGPDWARVAERARELAMLAEQCGELSAALR